MKNPKWYRIVVTYTGFSESKDAKIYKAAKKAPSQEGYDPVEAKRTIDFVCNSAKQAGALRLRLLAIPQQVDRFSVSKVIDDNF